MAFIYYNDFLISWSGILSKPGQNFSSLPVRMFGYDVIFERQPAWTVCQRATNVVFVVTKPESFSKRTEIRNTWMKQLKNRFGFAAVFIVGTPKGSSFGSIWLTVFETLEMQGQPRVPKKIDNVRVL